MSFALSSQIRSLTIGFQIYGRSRLVHNIFRLLVTTELIILEEVDKITLSRLEHDVARKLVDPQLLHDLKQVDLLVQLLLRILEENVVSLVPHFAARQEAEGTTHPAHKVPTSSAIRENCSTSYLIS